MITFREFIAEGSIGTSNYFTKAFGFVKKDAYKSESGHTVRGHIHKKEDREALMKHLRSSGYSDHPLHQYGESGGEEIGSTFHHPTDGSKIEVHHRAARRGVTDVGKIVIHAGAKK